MATDVSRQQSIERGVEALLREHPDARVCALSENGLIVPMPGQVPLRGQEMIEGRALIDYVIAADRKKVIDLWLRCRHEGSCATAVRLRDDPARTMTLQFVDIRPRYGVLLGIVLPAGEHAEDEESMEDTAPARPRFCTLTEDEGGNVLDCDQAFTQMLGYSREEVVGRSVLDHIHPDDQGRAVEGWLAMLATRRNQHTRLRRRHRDGHWVWVDTTLHNLLGRAGTNHVLVELIDVSAEMAAQEALQEREELLRRLTEAMPVGLLQLGEDGEVVYVNSHLIEIMHGAGAQGEARAGADGVEPTASLEAILRTLTPKGMTDFHAALADVRARGVDRDIEVDLDLPSGAWRRVLLTIRALLRPGGEVGGVIMCALDVTDSARARMELEERATVDALTGVLNRRAILGQLQAQLERGAGTGIVYVDLDNFKPVNDHLGHAAGDELLRIVADRLVAASRGADQVGRLGGDEFVVLLRDVTAPASAMGTAERIAQSLAGRFETSYGPVELQASVGVACVGASDLAARPLRAEDLVELADAAMYRSKECGSGRPVLAGAEHARRPGPAVAPGGMLGAA